MRMYSCYFMILLFFAILTFARSFRIYDSSFVSATNKLANQDSIKSLCSQNSRNGNVGYRSYFPRNFILDGCKRFVRMGMAKGDPFRNPKGSIDPIVINILVKILFAENLEDPRARIDELIQKRIDQDEIPLSDTELSLVRGRSEQVYLNRDKLRVILEKKIESKPLIRKWGGEAEFGLGSTLHENPLTQLCHAECLLALHMLAFDKAPVEFIDAERLEVLKENV
mmetsp:Transcript_41044/g.52904  ORF Transcript_41044/g.52904 Transcript_41044/m.52904 type:complete len:225 (+) Transcript_41044:128-802(+)